MSQHYEQISRRKFLGLGAVGVAIAALPRIPAAARADPAEPGGPERPRNGYRAFSEGRIAGLRTTNRLVRSATAEGASPDGRMNAEGLQIYERLAQGGVGLIVTGHIVAAPGGDVHANQTHLDGAQYLEAARSIVETVHRNGPACKVVAQLSHGGPNSSVDPIAPSAPGSHRDGRAPRVLSAGEIKDLVGEFAAAVRRAREAGFDGVELHGAHGFLLNTFLSPATNRRDDEYGGSVARRVSIVAQIVAAARREVGPDYPMLIKINCDDQGEGAAAVAGFVELVAELETAGVDAIDVSGQNPVRTKIDRPDQEAYFLPFAERARAKVPVIVTGGHRSIEHMEAVLQQGNVQFLALARPLVREPDLPRRFREGSTAVAACISCNRCLRGLGRAPTHCFQLKT